MTAKEDEVNKTNNNDNESCVNEINDVKKGAEIMHEIDMEDDVRQRGKYNVEYLKETIKNAGRPKLC
jgi:hypothetical protein